MQQILRSATLDSYPVSRATHMSFEIDRVRLFDIIIALVCLAILLPTIIIIAVAMLVLDTGPLIYAHNRVGRGGRSFPCFKFRTMVVDSHARLQQLLDSDPEVRAEWAATRKLRHDPRITPLGRLLRKSSLDELPQLLNVLRGEMSIVGPRPVVADEVRLYGPYARHYLSVKPGMTGLWQISGRSNVLFRRRVAMDVIYVRKRRLLWDMKILLLTIPVVLFARGSC